MLSGKALGTHCAKPCGSTTSSSKMLLNDRALRRRRFEGFFESMADRRLAILPLHSMDAAYTYQPSVSLQHDTIRVPLFTTRPMMKFHEPSVCVGEFCPLHNPSPHVLLHLNQQWRSAAYLMERICSHGVGHPDPDHISAVAKLKGHAFAPTQSLHGCDGCCSGVDYSQYYGNV